MTTRWETITHVTCTNHTSWTTATCIRDRTGTVPFPTRQFHITATTLPFDPMILLLLSSSGHHDLERTTTVRGPKRHAKKTPFVDGISTPTTNDQPLSTTRKTIVARTITISRTVQHSIQTIPT